MLKRIDFASCDTEPIHVIGAIQPNGALVAADAATTIVEFASANIEAYLGQGPDALLGSTLAAILGADACGELLARPLAPSRPDLLRSQFIRVPGRAGAAEPLECFPHVHDGRIVLELARSVNGPAVVWEAELIRQRIISDLYRPETLAELSRIGAEIVREATGFDRVMIYRFADDKHGEVIAESTVRPDSFLGLHYPASDIPDPARRHFVLNVIRSIPDLSAASVPIMARSGMGASRPLDLTFAKLRAVAPVHIEYLNNMGVAASMSISLISNNELWGLVACHHYSPLHLSWSRLRFCELLGGTMSALLQSLENTSQLRHSIRAEKTAFDIERHARLGTPLRTVIADHATVLMDHCSAQGMVLKLDGKTFEVGKRPAASFDYAALKDALVEGIATSDCLPVSAGSGQALGKEVAGAAMMELSDDGEDWLILFREPFEHTIKWAGKPGKLETPLGDGSVRLSPRGSFALWREERRGRSKPFTQTDSEILRITRRALFAMNSLDRERAAVAAKAEVEAEDARLKLVLLDAARNRSMGELASALAHELNQPLCAVTNYVNACRQELRNYGVPLPEQVGRLMESAIAESSRAADLVRRLRSLIGDGEVSLECVELRAVIRQGVALAMAATTDPHPHVVYRFEDGLPDIWLDPVQIAQVILNLVRNSLAAMRGSQERRLTISARRDGPWAEVSVVDTGPGIAKTIEKSLFEPFHNSTTNGMGIGLSLCRSIVEAHGGRIVARRIPKGTEFAFTLKLGVGHNG